MSTCEHNLKGLDEEKKKNAVDLINYVSKEMMAKIDKDKNQYIDVYIYTVV